MSDDRESLQAYARTRSEEAFARLVAKYADMVFHTALRRTHERQLAEDVTQAVFIVLARSAADLRVERSLAGWLHQTALYAASNALRSELRRARHERMASRRESYQLKTSEDEGSMVEEELHRLPNSDRRVLEMRYLEGLTMAQTASALNVSLEAARKRLSRALDRLRERLARRKIATGAGAIATSLGAITLAGAPQAQAAQISSLAIAGGKGGNAFRIAADVCRALRMIVLQKAAVLAAIIVLCGTIGIVIAQQRGAASATGLTAATMPQDPPASWPLNAVPLPDNIRHALLRNAAQLGPISVSWEKDLRLTHPAAADLNKGPNHGRYYHSLAWQDGKYLGAFKEDPGQHLSATHDRENQVACNGTMLFLESVMTDDHGERDIDLVIDRLSRYPNAEHAADAQFADDSYFRAAGFRLPVQLGDLLAGKPVRSAILLLLEQGAVLTAVDEVELDGRKLVRLKLVAENEEAARARKTDLEAFAKFLRERSAERDERIDEMIKQVEEQRQLPEQRVHVYYLDPQQNYAVRRCEEQYDPDILISRHELAEFEKLEGREVCLPRFVVGSFYFGNVKPDGAGEPVQTVTLKVTEIKVEPIPEASFTLECKEPGAKIVETTDPKEQKVFIVQPDGSRRPLEER